MVDKYKGIRITELLEDIAMTEQPITQEEWENSPLGTPKPEETPVEDSVYTIAIVKSYSYGEEYNSSTGRTEDKIGSKFLREGYVDGFVAGFSHRFTEGG